MLNTINFKKEFINNLINEFYLGEYDRPAHISNIWGNNDTLNVLNYTVKGTKHYYTLQIVKGDYEDAHLWALVIDSSNSNLNLIEFLYSYNEDANINNKFILKALIDKLNYDETFNLFSDIIDNL